jgi:hypothetical protein
MNPLSHNASGGQVNTNKNESSLRATRITMLLKTWSCDGDSALYRSMNESPTTCQVELSDTGGGGKDSSWVDCALARSGCGDVFAVVVIFLFFLIKLRTVSDGWAPLLIQYSARSTFNELL